MKPIIRSLLLLMLISFLLPQNVVYAVPPIAQQFYGNVTLDGSPAPDGTSITAEMNGRTAGSDSTSGGSYSLTIQTIEGDQAGDSISFYVNGLSAGSTSLNPGAITSRNLSATSPVPTFTLNVQRSGSGTVSPSLGSHTYNENTTVNISASPSSGWQFDSWSGDVSDPSDPTTTVVMNSNKTITANFIELPPGVTYTLTIEVTGEGTTSPSPGSRDYGEDDTVTVTATPADGWRFESWTGDVNNTGSASTSVTMDEDKTIIANFVLLIDETSPVITNVQVTNITRTSATITWMTNEIATSTVSYSPGNLNYIDSTLMSSHAVILTGLTPATLYTFTVTSADGAGNTSTSSEYSFKTDGLEATFITSDWRFEITSGADGGKNVSVEFVVTNIGDVAGSYNNILKINDSTVDTFEASFAPGASQVVTLSATQSGAGSYVASVEEFRVSFDIVVQQSDVDDQPGIPLMTLGFIVGSLLLLIIVVGLILSRTYYLFLLVRKDQ